jgi:hypothetical protein
MIYKLLTIFLLLSANNFALSQNVQPQNLGTSIGPSCVGVDYKSWSGCVGSMEVTDAPASWGNTTYTGEFASGKFSGRGILKTKGWTYYGEFIDGTRDGYGAISYSGGSKYSGQWSRGVRHGIGKYVYENRQGILIGEFKDGVDGKAVKYFVEGIVDDTKTGIYKNSKLIERVRIDPKEFPLFGSYEYPENNRIADQNLQEKINFYLNEATLALNFKDNIFACDLFIAAESYTYLIKNYPGREALSKKIDGVCQIASLEKEKGLKPFADEGNRMCSEYQNAKNKCAIASDYKKCMKILIPTYISSEMWCEK